MEDTNITPELCAAICKLNHSEWASLKIAVESKFREARNKQYEEVVKPALDPVTIEGSEAEVIAEAIRLSRI